MFTYDHALAVAHEWAKRAQYKQAVAESVPAAERGEEKRFVVGPKNGWNPPADRWRKVAIVTVEGEVIEL